MATLDGNAAKGNLEDDLQGNRRCNLQHSGGALIGDQREIMFVNSEGTTSIQVSEVTVAPPSTTHVEIGAKLEPTVLRQESQDDGDEGAEKVVLLQSLFRGLRSRRVHGARAKAGKKVICPFAESSSRVIDGIIGIADITACDRFFDLGCGNGVTLVRVASRSGAMCTGVDVDEVLCESAARRAKDAGVAHLVTIEAADLEVYDFSSATVIYMFLVPSCLKFMSPRIKELYSERSKGDKGEESASAIAGGKGKNGPVKIICYMFPLPEADGWVPMKEVTTQDVINVNNPDSLSKIYLYHL